MGPGRARRAQSAVVRRLLPSPDVTRAHLNRRAAPAVVARHKCGARGSSAGPAIQIWSSVRRRLLLLLPLARHLLARFVALLPPSSLDLLSLSCGHAVEPVVPLVLRGIQWARAVRRGDAGGRCGCAVAAPRCHAPADGARRTSCSASRSARALDCACVRACCCACAARHFFFLASCTRAAFRGGGSIGARSARRRRTYPADLGTRTAAEPNHFCTGGIAPWSS